MKIISFQFSIVLVLLNSVFTNEVTQLNNDDDVTQFWLCERTAKAKYPWQPKVDERIVCCLLKLLKVGWDRLFTSYYNLEILGAQDLVNLYSTRYIDVPVAVSLLRICKKGIMEASFSD